jgi:YegS/Rv2252/BmrU family lipid kinase
LLTGGPGEAAVAARRATREGIATLLVVGGDGTLSEVAQGCCDDEASRPGPALALFPLGTGTDFARGLGVRRDGAVAALLGGTVRTIDAGRVRYRDGDGERWRHFANIADFGLGRSTALAIERGPKRLGGTLAYLYGALTSIARYRPARVRVAVDGAEVYAGPSALVAVANGSYFGGGMHVAPHARHGDGRFEVLVVEGIGRRQLATDVLPKVYRGAHLNHPALHFFQGRRVTVDADGSFPLEADGEGLGDVPAELEIVPGALRILVPGDASPGRGGG